jgi:hypothetical protein
MINGYGQVTPKSAATGVDTAVLETDTWTASLRARDGTRHLGRALDAEDHGCRDSVDALAVVESSS